MRVIDPGHTYELLVLDGTEGPFTHEHLIFVKRIGDNYPGNKGFKHSGTTTPSVLRCLIDRTVYVNNQKPCIENRIVKALLSVSIWLLEFRAARRDGIFYWHSVKFACTAPMCPHCGHTYKDHI